MTEADHILSDVYQRLGIENDTDEVKYTRINDIVARLRARNRAQTINVKTTGTISERLCELGLKTAVPDQYKIMRGEWKWIGDFLILGDPFNVIVSVKSFKAKERLMSSGSGHVLSPTIGWGLFNDKREWSPSRTRSYLLRGFIAIYLPKDLYRQLPKESKGITNLNGRKFVRRLDAFTSDLHLALLGNRVDIAKM
ncbi:hypothetical protein ACFLV0_02025 [Chloroflexota bacterium]